MQLDKSKNRRFLLPTIFYWGCYTETAQSLVPGGCAAGNRGAERLSSAIRAGQPIWKKLVKNNPVKLFIASSSEGLEIARAVQTNLDDDDIHTTVWDQSIFKVSSNAIESLLREARKFDFAVFVLIPDDKLFIRNEDRECPRDNLIFELGLFIGVLGLPRCFAITPRDTNNLRLPTDLAGLITGLYDSSRTDLVAADGAACSQIRDEISEYRLPPTDSDKELSGEEGMGELFVTKKETRYGSFTVEQLEMTIGKIWQEYGLHLTQLLTPDTSDFYTQTHSHTSGGYFNYLKTKRISTFSFRYFDKQDRRRELICDIEREKERIEVSLHMSGRDANEILDKLTEELNLA